MPWSRIGRSMPKLRPLHLRPNAITLVIHISIAFVWLTAFRTGDAAGAPAAPPSGMAAITGSVPSSPDTGRRPQDTSTGRMLGGLTYVLAAATGDTSAGGDARDAYRAGLSPRGLQTAAVQAIEAEVAAAWAALREARVEQARLQASPEIVRLTAAEQTHAQAQARAARADVDLQRLSQPDSVQVDAAERALWRAEATLRVARSPRLASDATHDAVANAWEIRQAELVVEEARNRRDALRVGPSPETVSAARDERERAQAALQEATERLKQARQEASTSELDATNAAVLSASAGLTDAEARLQQLRSHTR